MSEDSKLWGKRRAMLHWAFASLEGDTLLAQELDINVIKLQQAMEDAEFIPDSDKEMEKILKEAFEEAIQQI